MTQNAPSWLDGLPSSRTPNAGRTPTPRADVTPDEWVAAAPSEGRSPAGWGSDPADLEAAVARLAQVSQGNAPIEGARDLETLLTVTLEGERRAQDNALKTATALESVTRWIERAERRFDETARTAADSQERTTAILNDAFAQLTQRLDTIEHKIAGGGAAPIANAQAGVAPRGFEEASDASERLGSTAPRPAGRRGQDARAAVRNAVVEIRSRQKELETGGARSSLGNRRAVPLTGAPRSEVPQADADVMLALKADIANLTSRLNTLQPLAEAQSPDVSAVRDEMERLQASLTGLATREDVAAMERVVQALARQIAVARGADDLAPLQSHLDALQAEVGRLSEAVTAELPARLAQEVDHLTGAIGAMAAGTGLEAPIAETLSRDLAALRGMIADMAEPHQVRDLARQVMALGDQVAGLAVRQVEPSAFAALQSAVDDIGAALRRPQPAPNALHHFDDYARTPDAYGERDVQAAYDLPPAGVEALLDRLDRLDESLRRPARPDGLKPIEDLLRSLAGKLDQAGSAAESETLDALERQVAALTARIDQRPGSDPALATLHQAMGDLMVQVERMREDTFDVVTEAARNAVAASIGGPGPDLGVLQRDLADLRAHQGVFDQRLHQTLTTVQTTLEQVATRLSVLELGDRGAPARFAPPVADAAAPVRRPAEALRTPPANPARRPDAPSDPILAEADRPLAAVADEILLEPGAARPRGEASAKRGTATDTDEADVKANFIAAARRAAQAAATEAAAANQGKIAGLPKVDLFSSPTNGAIGLAARAKALIDKRRRPLLLGLAAIVLALGALQFAGDLVRGGPKPAPTTAQRAEAPAAQIVAKAPETLTPVAAAVATPTVAPERDSNGSASKRDADPAASVKSEARTPDAPAVEAAVKPAEPAGPTPTVAAAAPAATPAERPAKPASMSEMPAVAPAGLRQAALAGDPAALFELATRTAEGRGVPRDLKFAAKLFELAADSGLVPAQYRVGNMYEKGTGVTRDLAVAKQWYQRAAEKGNAKAMHNLAVLLAEGAGGKPDYPAAVDWFRRAAEHGVRDSQFNLAVLQARGLGLEQDLKASYVWFAVAAGQGDADAGKKRDEVGARLSAADLATAKTAAERWRPATLNQAANEVTLPAGGWPEPPAAKKAASAGRV